MYLPTEYDEWITRGQATNFCANRALAEHHVDWISGSVGEWIKD